MSQPAPPTQSGNVRTANSGNAKAANAKATNAKASTGFINYDLVKEKINKLIPDKDKLPIILTLIVVALLLLLVILYILFMIKSPKLKGKQLTKTPIRLDELATAKEIDAAEIPATSVGREYSFSFWLYVDSFSQTTTTSDGKPVPLDKMIFYRGQAGDITTANPVVFMDGLSNKLYIAIKTQSSTPNSTSAINYNSNLYNLRYMNYFMNNELKLNGKDANITPAINKFLILTVDYIPLQRWVNITFVVDNKLLSVYIDGEIYSVKSTEEFKALREPERDLRGNPLDVNVIVDKTQNSLFVGKNSIGSSTTVSGYLSKLCFYNYAVSLAEIKKIYNEGPVGKVSALFGQNFQYGVRSPVYKLGTVENDYIEEQ